MKTQNTIYIKARQTVWAVRLDTILYMEQESRKITIHVTGGEEICFYGKYGTLMPLLDGRFAHPHQSYVINMQQVFRLGKNEVVMFNGNRILMGSVCFARMRKAYIQFINGSVRERPDVKAGRGR